jgi:putative ABC transport system permease protein
MEIPLILRALGRNKVGAILIGLQVALTLAIICNCLSIIQQRVQQMRRPTGIDEASIFTLSNAWIVNPSDLKARIEEDLAALRALPGVTDVEATNSYPLSGFAWSWGLALKPDQKRATALMAEYFVDAHGLAAYGLNLTAGRWFTSDEIGETHFNEAKFPATVVITQNLAKALFPSGNALGQTVYFTANNSSRVVGIVEKTQTPFAAVSFGSSYLENSVFIPFQFLNNGLQYIVRAMPGQQAAVIHAAPAVLYHLTRRRVIDDIRPFSETRRQAYLVQHSTAVMLGVLSTLLLAITAFGVVGLTMYWVTQRRRIIGVRRAMGACRFEVLRYFHIESLLITGTGCLLGIALGLAGNAWLASHLELTRMSVAYICIGALCVLTLCQTAVIWPAVRAASISPATAFRSV